MLKRDVKLQLTNYQNCSVLCCVVFGSCAQWYVHTYEQFLKMSVGFGLGLVSVHLFRFSLCDFLSFAFVVLDLVSLVLRQEIG